MRISKKPPIEIHEIKAIMELSQDLDDLSVSAGIERIQKIEESLQDRSLEANSLDYATLMNRFGAFYGKNGLIPEAVLYFEKLLSFAQKHNMEDYVRTAQTNLAITHAQRGYFNEAIDLWLDMLEKEDSLDTSIRLLTNISVGFGMKGDQEKAIHYSYRAIEMIEGQNKPAALVDPYMNLGAAYDLKGEKAKAKEYWQKALALAERFKDYRRVVGCLNNLSLSFKAQDDTKTALEYAHRALDIYEQHFQELDNSLILNNIGFILEGAGEYEQALLYYTQALSKMQQSYDKMAECNTMMNVGSIKILLHDYPGAIEYLQNAQKMALEMDLPDFIKRANELFSEVYAAQGQYEKAYHYQKLLSDDIEKRMRILVENTISKSEANYYHNKMEHQAELYRKQNQELIRKNRIIKKNTNLLSQKNQDMQDTVEMLSWVIGVISHDVRAPLANFNRILKMMIDGDFADTEYPEILQSLQKSSENIYTMINEMLDGIRLRRQKMDSTTKIENVDIIPILQAQVAMYYPIALQHNIDLSFSYSKLSIYAAADSDLLKIVVRNLLNNAIKYTPENGKVMLDVSCDDTQAIVTISDTGIGMTPRKVQEVMRSKTTLRKENLQKGDTGIGLGWGLCKESLKKMKGTLNVKSEPGKGTMVQFFVPLGS